MSDLSPECAPKRTSVDRSGFMSSRSDLSSNYRVRSGTRVILAPSALSRSSMRS